MKIFTKDVAIKLLKIIITVLIVYYIINKLGWENITKNISSANPIWLIAALIGFIISIMLGAYQWRIILKTKGIVISIKRAVSIYMTGIFINNFMFGMIAGDAYKVGALHIREKAGKEALAATFLDRLAGLMVISLFAVLGGVFLIINSNESSQPIFYTIIGISLFATLFLSLFLLLISERLQKLFKIIVNKLPSEKIKTKVLSLLEYFYINRKKQNEREMLIFVLFLSIVIQAIRVSVHILCAFSLGMLVGHQIHYFFIIIPITAIMMIIPLPLGVKEGVAGVLFGLAGFSLEASIPMEFLATIIGIVASLFGGITFLLEKKDKTVFGDR